MLIRAVGAPGGATGVAAGGGAGGNSTAAPMWGWTLRAAESHPLRGGLGGAPLAMAPLGPPPTAVSLELRVPRLRWALLSLSAGSASGPSSPSLSPPSSLPPPPPAEPKSGTWSPYATLSCASTSAVVTDSNALSVIHGLFANTSGHVRSGRNSASQPPKLPEAPLLSAPWPAHR